MISLIQKDNTEISSQSLQWFDELVSTIRAHELQIETNTAPKEHIDFCSVLMSGNTNQMAFQSKYSAQRYFVSKILVEYVHIIKDFIPNKLAFDFRDAEILVWAEIDDNNFDLEKKIILAEAKINALYHQFGFDMTTSIVDKEDNLRIPNHYKIYKA